MAKLPFVVQPRLQPIKELIGSVESGQLEIERKGYLTVAEKSFVQTATAGDSAVTELHQLAQRISRKTGHKATEVFQMLVGQADDPEEHLLPFEKEISDALSNLLAFQEKQKLAVSACLLINRVDSSLTIDDALELHPDLVADLMRLYEDEDRKCTDALEAAMEENKSETPEEGKE